MTDRYRMLGFTPLVEATPIGTAPMLPLACGTLEKQTLPCTVPAEGLTNETGAAAAAAEARRISAAPAATPAAPAALPSPRPSRRAARARR
eukprot:CAMPEP_0115531424 /NCGR_PEP_ID=MMETSP0271-20121206/85037_1 /TAXON_ID=71861 /ORGANISM="Scrippsiella trochoidea, Strain CCMP3099" /LENGTH=90 /DNA_ID=CAMNT_0002963651 /DNA_START=60 /DNA_END=329 /DNA_ORIENTATION=+